jgi:translation initiation factor IF-1
MEVYVQSTSDSTVYLNIKCRIRGALRAKISPEDYVLVQIFDFNSEQGQIVDVYTSDEVSGLIKAGLWDMTFKKPEESKVDDLAHIFDSESEYESESESAISLSEIEREEANQKDSTCNSIDFI